MSDYDLIVVGAGPVGSAAATALARLGRSVALIDQRAPAAAPVGETLDARVVAVSPGSQLLLSALGVWSQLDRDRLAPYHRMQVCAGAGSLIFTANEHALSELGWIAELPALEAAAAATAGALSRVDRVWPASIQALEIGSDAVDLVLEDGRRLRGHVLLGADGARSRVREAAGIDLHSFHYNQRALIAQLSTALPNPGIAWQRFTELGPLALLPLPGGGSSLVWSVHVDQAERLEALDEAEFVAALEQHAVDHPFGRIESAGPRHARPLVRRQSQTLAAGRIALLGDAARSVHPLAGQGLNLGLGDIAALIEALHGWTRERDPSARLARYGRRRWSDSALIAGGIHLFNESRMLGAPGRSALGLGFKALARSRLAREIFVRRACAIGEVAEALKILSAEARA